MLGAHSNVMIMQGFDGSKTTYIATQAPMKSTVEDFLHMILEYKCPVVIMNSSNSKHNEVGKITTLLVLLYCTR